MLKEGFPLVGGHPDVAGVLRQPDLLRLLGPTLAAPFADQAIAVVCAPEARGPILGALVAAKLGAGLMVVRKHGRNHAGANSRVKSGLTWRGTTETFIARSWDLEPGDRVLIVDDWITTGNSIRAVRELIELAGGSASVQQHHRAEPSPALIVGCGAAPPARRRTTPNGGSGSVVRSIAQNRRSRTAQAPKSLRRVGRPSAFDVAVCHVSRGARCGHQWAESDGHENGART